MKKAMIFAMLLLSLLSLTAAQLNVVGEVFTESWWGYCPRARTGLFNLYNNHPNVVPLIWQGDSSNQSPNYSSRRGLVGSNSQGIPQTAFQGTELEVGAAVDAYNAQFLPIYNQLINNEAPMTIDSYLLGSAGEYSLNANIQLEEAFDNANVKVLYILTRYITDSYFSSVIAYAEEDFTQTNAGQSGAYSHAFSVDSSWDASTIKGFVLVQRMLTGDSEIFQADEAGSSAVSMTEADFGPAYIGSAFTKSFVVANVSGSTTDVTITMDAPGFELSGEMNYSLAGGAIQNHTITFLPTEEENYSGVITIATDIPGFEMNTISLSGSGFTNQAPVAENLRYDGVLMKNFSVDVIYDFMDADDDDEGETMMAWYSSDDGENWTDFNNINADIQTLHFTADHVGKYFKFTLTPIDEHQMPGQEISVVTPTPISDLVAPTNFAYTIENGNDVVLTWDPPIFPEVRGLFGYKIQRGSAFIATIMDTETLTYTDENVEDGTHVYVIKGVYSPGGLSMPSEPIEIIVNNGVSNENDTQELIVSKSSYPNPFSQTSAIDIQAKRAQHIQVAIYNLKGQLIKTLADETFAQGMHNISWDGRDQNGNKCSNGVYFYKVVTPKKTFSSKTILIK